MSDIEKGDDAADHAPKPKDGTPKPPSARKQDAPNYDDAEDGGRTVPLEDMNSANDE